MFVPFRGSDGKWRLRPAFIGFIENNTARRAWMVLMWPIVLLVTFATNYFLIIASCAFDLIAITFKHAKMLKKMPWHDDVWDEPRK